jgi:hypothetical protein
MKLIIQIPASTRSRRSRHAGRPAARVPGFDAVEWLVIDDGSTDRTVEVARATASTTSSA